MVLLRRQFEEPVEAVSTLHRRQVDEVPGLCPAEYRKDLVDREFLAAERRRGMRGLGGEEPGVGSQVEFRAFVAALHDQPREPCAHLDMPYDESCLLQRAVDSGHETVDVGRRKPEEIEVLRLSPNVAARDQGRASGQREVLRLGKPGDDRGDLLL